MSLMHCLCKVLLPASVVIVSVTKDV